MKSTVEKLSGLSHKVTVEVPAEKVQQAFNNLYQRIQKTTEIKGFRKGKAPLATIKSMYADRVQQDALQGLISEGFQTALDEHSLQPVGQPAMDFKEFDEDKDFTFTVNFEVRPEVKLNQYENLKVQKEKLDISDERVSTVLENLRQQHSDTEAVLEVRPAQNGDVAVIDFDGFIDDQPLEGGSAQDFDLELGSHSFIDGFEEAIVGMNVNDHKAIDLKFPENYHNKDVAGKPVLFKTTLKALKKKVASELNDEFAKKLGAFETLDQLKDSIKKDLESTEVGRIEEEFKNRVLKSLVEANPVEVPQNLKAEQKVKLIENVKQKMTEQGMSEGDLKDYVEKWNDDFEKTSSEMIQSSFLIDALADKLELHATATDIENRINDYAQRTGIEIEKVQEFYATQDRKANLAYQITEQNVISHLISKADVQVVDAEKLK